MYSVLKRNKKILASDKGKVYTGYFNMELQNAQTKNPAPKDEL